MLLFSRVRGEIHGMKAVNLAALDRTEYAIAKSRAVLFHLREKSVDLGALGVVVGGAGRFVNGEVVFVGKVDDRSLRHVKQGADHAHTDA